MKLINKVLARGGPPGRDAATVTCSNWNKSHCRSVPVVSQGDMGPRLMEEAEGAREGIKVELMDPVLS